MDIRQFATMENAFGVLDPDKEYTLTRHHLKRGEWVYDHFHPLATETIIAPRGGFVVRNDFSRHHVEQQEGFVAITFPSDTIHGIEGAGELSYLVMREQADTTVWVRDLLRKREFLTPIESEGGLVWELHNAGNLSVAYVRTTGTAAEHVHRMTQEIYHGVVGWGGVMVNGTLDSIGKGRTLVLPPGTRHYLKMVQEPFDVLAVCHPGYDPKDVFIP